MSDIAKFGTNPKKQRINAPTVAGQESSAEAEAVARCWAQSGDSFFPVAEVEESLPAGAYRCKSSPNSGPYLEKMPIAIDSLLMLPDSSVEVLMNEFDLFWKIEKNFADRGFTYKRGILMYGPPGSGKTSAIWQMTQSLIQKKNGVVLFIENPAIASSCIHILRRIEPDRPLVTVMEDIDTIIEQHGDHGLLAMLDGETQVSKVVHVATTNYPEYLDKRFVDRPSRFDTLMYVGMPTAAARRVYFKAKEPDLDEETLERWVERTEDYSVAYLREVIIAIKCFNQEEEAVFERLDKMRTEKPKSDGLGGDRRVVGFK